jgi:hypothetical protein
MSPPRAPVASSKSKAPAKRAPRPQGPRVNLTLPPELDAVLSRMTALTGRGKASFVTQTLMGMLPALHQMVQAMELASAGNLDAYNVMASALRDATKQGEQAELELKSARRRAARRKTA